jgi:RNA polymerase sigma factor (sigma-70 family)
MNNKSNATTTARIQLQTSSLWFELTQSKNTENRKSFNERFVGVIPEIKKYIDHRLRVQKGKEGTAQENLGIDAFVSDLFIEAFDNFSSFKDSDDLSNWLYQKVDELIEDASIEDQFNDLFFKNIDDYTQVEWDTMEEKFTVDGGGDFIMEEELLDKSRANYSYTLKDVFIEDRDQDLITKIDAKLKEEKINNHINLILNNIPIKERNLFDLAATQKLSVSNIARIKSMEINEISDTLDSMREILRSSFIGRFNLQD